MTIGRPGQPGLDSVRWVRERLLGLGLTEDHLILSPLQLPPRLAGPDLEPASYLPEFGPLVQRVGRLLGGGRGLSIYVTGGRAETLSRAHAALQIALGVAPSGRQVVIVDADFMRPGLGGLVADSTAEGVIDLVRFGRSTRSLLLRPVPEGPWLLAAGSFPVDDPVPLEPDALRSVVYRVSQVCDLALYVGPLPIRNELHPLARVCDHVVYVGQDDGGESASTLVESVAQLQQQNAHLAGLVLYAPESRTAMGRPEAAPYAAPPRMEAPPVAAPSFPGSFEAAPPESPRLVPEPANPYSTLSPPPAFEPPSPPAGVPMPAVPELPPAVMPSIPRLPPVALPPVPHPTSAPDPELWNQGPRPEGDIDWSKIGKESAEEEELTLPSRRGGERVERAEGPDSGLDLPPLDLPPFKFPGGTIPGPLGTASDVDSEELIERTRRELAEAVARRRPREEAHEVGRNLNLKQDDFAFESEGRGGRGPLLLVVALVLGIAGFAAWAFWWRDRDRAIEPRVAVTESPAPASGELPKPEPPPSPPTSAEPSSKPSGEPSGPGSSSGTTPSTGAPESSSGATGSSGGGEKVTEPPPPAPTGPAPDDRAAARRPGEGQPPQGGASTAPSQGGASTAKPPVVPPATRTEVPPASKTEPPAPPKTAVAKDPVAPPPKDPMAPPPVVERRTEPAASPPVASADAPYSVHVASYKTMQQAQKDIDTLQKHGFEARAIQTDLGSKGVWFRVYVGSFGTAGEANAMRDKVLALPGYDFAQVRRLPRD